MEVPKAEVVVLDIGVIIQAPMEDKAWLKKCLVMGLLALIPIAGALNAMGWMRTYADARIRGENQLPEAGLSYMGDRKSTRLNSSHSS